MTTKLDTEVFDGVWNASLLRDVDDVIVVVELDFSSSSHTMRGRKIVLRNCLFPARVFTT